MTSPERRADAQSRLRKAHSTLGAARALLSLEPPCRDDAVNRASVAALQAARALVDSQWARDSQPSWDPTFRPGMAMNAGFTVESAHKLLDRFERLASSLRLAPDFTQYIRTLVEDGLEADTGEAPEYDDDEARVAIETATRLVMTVAEQIGLATELRPELKPEHQLELKPELKAKLGNSLKPQVAATPGGQRDDGKDKTDPELGAAGQQADAKVGTQ